MSDHTTHYNALPQRTRERLLALFDEVDGVADDPVEPIAVAFAEVWQELEDLTWEVYHDMNVDDAQGDALDVFGAIADVPRYGVTSDAVYRSLIRAKLQADRISAGEAGGDLGFIDTMLDVLAKTAAAGDREMVHLQYHPLYPAGYVVDIITEETLDGVRLDRVTDRVWSMTPAGVEPHGKHGKKTTARFGFGEFGTSTFATTLPRHP